MSNETRKGFVRIISNYTRLLITLGMGIIVVPMTIRWLGDDAFGIISLMGANIGLAGIFRQIIQMSLVRELGHAYHKDDETFKRNFASICAITLACTLLSLVSFGIVFSLVPYFKIPPHFIIGARWFVVGQGLQTAVMILTAPIFNMYLVRERFVEYNIWLILIRMSNLFAVLILAYAFVVDDPVLGLSLLGLTWSLLASLTIIIACWIMISRDPRVMFRLKGGSREGWKQVFSTFSWNTGVQVAMNLHEQIPPLLLNLFYGTLANAAWGIGFRFVAYIRMCTTGVQFGSDAVSARLASGDDDDASRKRLQRLISIQTKLTAMIALPATVIVFIYGWPIFDVWVGRSLQDYGAVMPIAVYMSRILSIAIAARAISDTWLLVLYGAGFVKAYAPWIFMGGIIAPIVSLVLVLVLPKPLLVYAPPAIFALVLVVVHLFGLPLIAGRCLHIRPIALLLSLVRPIMATIIAIAAAVLLLYLGGRIEDLGFGGQLTFERGRGINWYWMLGSILFFGAVYSLCCYTFVLETTERERLRGMLLRRASAVRQAPEATDAP